MKKILFIILCLSFISCSNLYKANRAYDRGDYVQNVELTFKYFDEKPENFKELKEKKKIEINNKFSNIFEYYKKLKNSQDLVDRNNANIELFKIYIVSDNSEYSREFQAEKDFLASNNIKDIFNLALKTNKELFSQYSGINADHSYALKVINHTLNMESSIDEVLQGKTNLDTNKMKRYKNLKREIAKYRADGYIALAKVEEEQGSNSYLRSAQSLYHQASEIYSKYQTNYKNSYSNYENVKHQADLNDARDNYNKGMEEYRNAGSSKAKYRAANYYFREAQKYVSNYKDINKLLSETKEKGYFKYSLSSNNSEISSRINDAMSSIGYSVSNGIELFIEYKNGEYSYNTSSNTNTEQMSKEVQTGTDSAGKPIITVFNFTKTTTTIEEVGTIHYFLSMRGVYYSNNINNDVTVRNTVKNVKYSGNVPPNSNYRDSDNRTLGSSEIQRKVAEKLRQEVNSNINSMVSDLKRI
ncbi:MarR family transcriptional regulator [Fusobacterium animalis]|uniref:MarR family transcriptional regulator n=1 Tax=Fusobacterium animalis TaxID=76859 RepID=UPI0030D460A1